MLAAVFHIMFCFCCWFININTDLVYDLEGFMIKHLLIWLFFLIFYFFPSFNYIILAGIKKMIKYLSIIPIWSWHYLFVHSIENILNTNLKTFNMRSQLIWINQNNNLYFKTGLNLQWLLIAYFACKLLRFHSISCIQVSSKVNEIKDTSKKKQFKIIILTLINFLPNISNNMYIEYFIINKYYLFKNLKLLKCCSIFRLGCEK